MRKITAEASKAFFEAKNFNKSNTTVYCTLSSVTLQLHHNDIARIDETKGGYLEFTLSGWNSPTTRERLKGIGIIVKQRNFSPIFVNGKGEEFDINCTSWYRVTKDGNIIKL